MNYVLSIDQGTTSSRAILYDEAFQVVATGQEAFSQYYPQPDWVEHDLDEVWASVTKALERCFASVKIPSFSKTQIKAIGITNQRETFGVWSRKDGKPVAKAIVWQCRRSAGICAKLRKSVAGKKLAKLTGLVIDPYFSGTKLKWMFDQDASLAKSAKAGALAFGTIDTFLIWKLTRGKVHATDVSNASRTMLMDLKKRTWSPVAMKTLGIPVEMLPEIRSSDAAFGTTSGLGILPDGIPIHGVLGDQQAALFGQACFAPGQAKLTYGTGAFLLINTGAKARPSKAGVSTVAWTLKGKTSYAVEGSVFIAGAAVQWLRDGLGLFEKSGDVEGLAETVADSDGVFFVPALTGLGAPYWDPQARGVIGGLTRRSTKAHVARACLEGIAASVGDLFLGLEKDGGVRCREIRVDGGASANLLLLKRQADLLQVRIVRPKDVESTARGAAYMAALGAGLISSAKELIERNPSEVEVKATMSAKAAAKEREAWRRRVEAARIR